MKEFYMNVTEVVSYVINVLGSPLNMKDYAIFVPFYMKKTKRKLLKMARQLGKTIGICALQLTRAAITKYTKSLTVLPSQEHAHRFSQDSIATMIQESPIIKTRLSNKLLYGEEIKQFNNGSKLYYSHIGDSPMRVRGISVRDFYVDELQDIILENMYIAEMCTSHYSNSRFHYSGTPLTLDNAIEGLWMQSSQNEAYITCSRCHFDNFSFIPDVYKMIVPKGLSCQKCGGVLHVEDIYRLSYQAMKPEMENLFDGWHAPQIFTPFNLTAERWTEVLKQKKDYSESQFANEVLGHSFDVGGRPITITKLQSLCDGNRKLGEFNKKGYIATVMGIDWGYATVRSLTVGCILGITKEGKADVLWAKKYHYRDREDQVVELLEKYSEYGCVMIGADHGVGLSDNQKLRSRVSASRFIEYQYCAPKKLLTYDPDTLVYPLNRTRSIDLLFTDLNKGYIRFPRMEDSSDFFNDILSIYEEVRESPSGCNKFYSRNHSIPDDFLHSLNFAWICVKILTRDNILDTVK